MARVPPRPTECANCGAAIPCHARSCPECGADERTGWRETDVYDGLDLPDSAWDDAEDAPRAQRPSASRRPGELPWYWWATGFFLLLALTLLFLGLR